MLVLTRKAKQQIRLGDDIVITVLQVKGNAIRLGIEAPRETRVVRGELQYFAEEPKKTADAKSQSAEVERSLETKRSANPVASLKSVTQASQTASSKASSQGAATSTGEPAGIRICGPTRLKIQSNEATAERFPATMQRSGTSVPEARPLKRFMPKTMIETVGNVSV